ncbi:MAG: PIN domain-containing protein [Candidatus Portnoybacteria bacterium]|nr:PIN domain-containing protein [Candidatus Portnoybacteria bacterium]
MEIGNVFVDSNVFIALFNKDDSLHERAVKLWHSLRKRNYRVCVSNFVVSEVITVLSQRVGKEIAIEFAVTMYENERRETSIIYSSERIERKALEYIKSIPSKNFSFVDATIFAILELYEMKNLASFDKVFRRLKGIKIFS